MPHVNLRRSYVISEGLRRRAPFPSGSVSAIQSTTTASHAKAATSSSGLSPAMIGVAISAVVATILVVAVLLYKFRTRKSEKVQSSNKVPVNEKLSPIDSQVKGDIFAAAPIVVEKPKAIYLSDPNTTYEESVGWVPQIKAYNGVPITHKQFEKNVRYPRALAMWEKAQTAADGSLRQQTPVQPSCEVPRRTSSPTRRPKSPPGPSKPAPKPPKLEIPAPEGLGTHLPSPMRSASLPQQVALTPKPTTPFSPRLMTVCNTFVPTLNDEIPVVIGETVLLMEEYDDGWCLVQCAGSKDKGIIPRFCLTERRR